MLDEQNKYENQERQFQFSDCNKIFYCSNLLLTFSTTVMLVSLTFLEGYSLTPLSKSAQLPDLVLKLVLLHLMVSSL